MTPSQWEDSLYNLKALGANTVETYIPWNIHEPEEGVYDFEGMKTLKHLSAWQKTEFTSYSASFGLYLCRMGVWWLTSMAFERKRCAITFDRSYFYD